MPPNPLFSFPHGGAPSLNVFFFVCRRFPLQDDDEDDEPKKVRPCGKNFSAPLHRFAAIFIPIKHPPHPVGTSVAAPKTAFLPPTFFPTPSLPDPQRSKKGGKKPAAKKGGKKSKKDDDVSPAV